MSANPSDRLHALSAAREILKQNPGTPPLQLVALGWIEGRLALCKELRPTLEPKPGLHEYDCICQRCGRRASSRFVIAADAPKAGFFQVVCDVCSTADAPRSAA
jgi:hypothetical protein